MSLQATANLLQQQGRNDDKMLVHMTPREVAGLEAIAKAKGGSLTINPKTGLPEAGFLDDVLPIAASAALMYFGGPLGASIGQGMGLSGALAQGVGMGLLAGGATTLLTGDLDKGLKTGLTAGVLSGGMSALSGPSTVDVPTANVETVTPAMEAAKASTTMPSAGQGVNPTVAEMASGKGAAGMTPTPEKSWWGSLSPREQLMTGIAGTAGLSLLGGMQKTGEAAPTDKGTIRPYQYSTAMRQPQQGQSQFFQPVQYDLAGRTTSPMDTSERTYFDQSYKALPTYEAANGGEVPPNLDRMPAGGLAAIQGMRDGYGAMQTMDGNIPQMANGGPVAFGIGGSTENVSEEAALPKFTYDPATQKYAPFVKPVEEVAQENIGRKSGFRFTNPILALQQNANTIGAGLSRRLEAPPVQSLPKYSYDPSLQAYTALSNGGDIPQFNMGGTQNYAGGRLLKGPGDGVSDSIEATINGTQPARLADGEFVIPARIVSELGNGSTDAGAKRLYDMMDRIQADRKKSIGKGKVAVDAKARKHLPA